MKDHIINKKELERRLREKGWPFMPGDSLTEVLQSIDLHNTGRMERRTTYTMVFWDHDIDDHNTKSVLVPYIEPATVQNLMAEYHKITIESKVISLKGGAMLKAMLSARAEAIKDMLENGIDATPFDI